MRDTVKDFKWHIYGLSVSDYDDTIRLINDITDDRTQQHNQRVETIEEPEAISDLAHYTYIENLFLWHFALWRLQGIFEGILKQEFFPDVELKGLKAKLDYVLVREFTITNEDYKELLSWGKLRNALSHFPPEHYQPPALEKEDVIEYVNLIKRITNDLLAQKSQASAY